MDSVFICTGTFSSNSSDDLTLAFEKCPTFEELKKAFNLSVLARQGEEEDVFYRTLADSKRANSGVYLMEYKIIEVPIYKGGD